MFITDRVFMKICMTCPCYWRWRAYITGLILGLCPANEGRRYQVTPSLIGWAQTLKQPCITYHLTVIDHHQTSF